MNVPKKKLLILYASAGSGHKKAAEAISTAAQKMNYSVEVADIVSFMPYLFAKLYTDGYILLIKYFPRFWGFLYLFFDSPFFSVINIHFRRFVNRISCKNLIAFLIRERPAVVISTQFLASEITSYAKSRCNLKTKLITVITDFGVHNFWISTGTDIYTCASDKTKKILVKKGINPDKIKVTGIPLDEKFLIIQDKRQIKTDFDLKDGLFTILIMTGGIGAGPIEEIVDLLKNDNQLLVICGTNKTLFKKLTLKKHPNVKIFGFIDCVQKLMSVSQIVITKAGGLSVTESLAMGLPMIFFFLIPGQEEINARTIECQHAGFIVKNTITIRDIVLKIKNDPAVLSALKSKAVSLSKPNSACDIVALSN